MKTTTRTASFGPYALDLRSGELRKFGTKVKLGEQTFQILRVLLETPGELVTREELRAKLWAGDTFVDFEHGLNSAVQRLRDCLSDSAGKPRWVQTVPRRGYRFVGQVEW
jgi:DNA-binding winged helix-turn-helix (wHTH) protein